MPTPIVFDNDGKTLQVFLNANQKKIYLSIFPNMEEEISELITLDKEDAIAFVKELNNLIEQM